MRYIEANPFFKTGAPYLDFISLSVRDAFRCFLSRLESFTKAPKIRLITIMIPVTRSVKTKSTFSAENPLDFFVSVGLRFGAGGYFGNEI